ncbi:MAG: hypothetical protein IPM92_02500 [Saprospiraceae bacterium]|nr:hypothetical protein [Saprospiraceae bacterium]
MMKNFRLLNILSRFSFLVMVLILCTIAILLYDRSLSFGYVLDDIIVYTENSFVQKGFDGIWDILSTESFTGYFGEQKDLVTGARYRPLSLVGFAIEFEIFGNKPHLSHLINILLYALTAALVFKLLQLLLPDKSSQFFLFGIPAITSILFLTHPIHSEAVANIKGRDEIMCLLFSLSAAISWVKYIDSQKKIFLISSCALFLLALFSKENAITFTAIIPLMVSFFRTIDLKKSIIMSWPLLICAAIFIGVRWLVIGYLLSSGAVITDLMNNPFIGMSLGEKTATLFYTFIWYYKLLFFPHPLTHDYYPYHVPKSDWTDLISIFSLIITAMLIYLAFRLRNRNKIISFSLFYYFISFSIVSNLVFPVGTFMNERFLFMPSVGFSLLCGYFIYWLANKPSPKFMKWLAALLFMFLFSAYSFKTIQRVPDWKDGFTLNLSAVKVSKNSARINLFTGVSYFQKSQSEMDPAKKSTYLQIAEKYIDQALVIFPQYGQGLNMKAGILAEWLKRDNDIITFLKKLEGVIKVKPDLDFVTKYMDYLTKDPENLTIMHPYLKRVGYEILYKEVQNFQFSLHFLGMAYHLKNDDAELCYFISKVYTDFAKFGKVSSTKILEYENKAKDFLNQAAALDPKYVR